METTNKEINCSEVNKEEAELACLGDMCCWKEADQLQRENETRLLIRDPNLQPHLIRKGREVCRYTFFLQIDAI